MSISASSAHAVIFFSETFDANSRGWSESGGWDVTGGGLRYTSTRDYFTNYYNGVTFGGVSASSFATGSYTLSFGVRFLDPWVGFLASGYYQSSTTGRQTLDNASKEYGLT